MGTFTNRYLDQDGGTLSVGYVVDSTGNFAFSPDSLPQALTYDASNNLQTITVGPDPEGNYFKQTYTYTGSNVTGVSAWIKV